ncbi:16S rRNA (cytosine(1402)-N(4))-methyltransferase RsmH [Thermoactinomyces sp. DSM 45892]|uniref:16S rRNA (cytosine(1402)-N(4))-methyltransferase RsmH n=1 Tax=Thermoactinomyces sp. DSM 45892 TaxID=1882753 RepID=UPI00089A5818|nr:16S rRNA (cytosine(1402)-N(4))-methyltransferase RsmH [Thermoactinomyces sp. DSM 45892]SDY60976.1 16S rRNA (cytosine1402-N4)-methyltransferase [Thermoactinomyces sp. DSM 45892]
MFNHVTVLRDEAVDGLKIKPDGIYVDCTLGGAGHSGLIASRLSQDGVLIGLDQDEKALSAARKRLEGVTCKVHLVKTNFRHIAQVVKDLGFTGVDGILFDLGVSSPQLDESERGFSYHYEAPLDMRMDREQERTAFEVVNQYDEAEIARILYIYGEEKFSRRIAKRIVEYRTSKPIETTTELAEIIKEAIPAATRRSGPHPARRSFQAIRIAVNEELTVFEEALEQVMEILAPRGRVSVITFHSLEDRICKQFYLEQAKGCICPPNFPICTCHQKPKLKIITRKPIAPSAEELEQNARARSAKLRVAEKI